MLVPDHSTIADFRRRHETEIARLFDEVLGLCRAAGLVRVGVIAVDGTRMRANASRDRNRGYESIVAEILKGRGDVAQPAMKQIIGKECHIVAQRDHPLVARAQCLLTDAE